MFGKLHKKSVIIYCAALIFSLIITGTFFYEKKKEVQYDIVILGDSIVGNAWGDVSVISVLEQRLGKTVYNGALGGTRMSVRKKQMWGSMSSMEWSLVKLTEAICYDDWKSQQATMKYADSYSEINTQALSYFAKTMDGLMQIDFSKVEILIIEHGTNDYNSGQPVDNPEDLYDVTTFGGALRSSLSMLQSTYPDLRIIILSPTYCALGEKHDAKCYDTSYGEGGVLDEYVQAEKEIAQEFGVEWIDAYHDSGIWEENADYYLNDFLHLTEAGHELLGNLVADYLEANEK